MSSSVKYALGATAGGNAVLANGLATAVTANTTETVDAVTGTTVFGGNGAYWTGCDYAGVQVAGSGDKFQLVCASSNRLQFRENDTSLTDTNWTNNWITLMAPQDVKAGSGLTATVNGNTNAIQTVTVGHSNSVTAKTTFEKPYFKYDAQGHITASTRWIHTAAGTSNTAGWIKIATMKHTATYDNTPIMLTIAQRGSIVYRLHIQFANANSTDPNIGSFILFHDAMSASFSPRAYMIKSATSTWDLYVLKLDNYEALVVTAFDVGAYFENHMTWTWTDVQTAASAITGGTEATKKVYSTTDHTHGNYLGAKNDGSYYGMTNPSGTDSDWIRTTSKGIIPYEKGSAGSGHNSIGTPTWYFSAAYIDTVNGALVGDVQHYVTNPTSATTYGISFHSSANSTGTKALRTNDGLRHLSLEGTASAVGYGFIVLGNNIASGTAGNKYGGVRWYGTGVTYCQLSGGSGETTLRFSQSASTAGSNISPATTNIYDLGTSSLKWRNVYATTFTGALSGNATTATSATSATTATNATNAYSTLTNPTSATTYYVDFHSGASNGNKALRHNNGLWYYTLGGTTSAIGEGTLALGNSTASSTAGNKKGFIRLYGTHSGYQAIEPLNTTSTSYTAKLPAITGGIGIYNVLYTSTAAPTATTQTVNIASASIIGTYQILKVWVYLGAVSMTREVDLFVDDATFASKSVYFSTGNGTMSKLCYLSTDGKSIQLTTAGTSDPTKISVAKVVGIKFK